jgi:hypothetical protein
LAPEIPASHFELEWDVRGALQVQADSPGQKVPLVQARDQALDNSQGN